MKRQNFSLVELVIVLAVAFLMVTLGIAAVTRMADGEKDVACKENLKKFGVALQQYAGENGGFLPFPGLVWNEKNSLGKTLGAYLSNVAPSKNPEMFVCPADDRKMEDLQEGGSKFWMQTPEEKWAFYKVSYGINLVVTGMPNNLYLKAHRLATLDKPAECFMFSDSTVRDNPGDVKRFAPRHENKSNIVYADGHVADIKADNIPGWNSSMKQAFWVGGTD